MSDQKHDNLFLIGAEACWSFDSSVDFPFQPAQGALVPITLTTEEGIASYKCLRCGLEFTRAGKGAFAEVAAFESEHVCVNAE